MTNHLHKVERKEQTRQYFPHTNRQNLYQETLHDHPTSTRAEDSKHNKKRNHDTETYGVVFLPQTTQAMPRVKKVKECLPGTVGATQSERRPTLGTRPKQR